MVRVVGTGKKMLFSLTKIPCFLATGTELETSNVYTHIFSLSSPKGFVTDVLSQGAGVHVTPPARTPKVGTSPGIDPIPERRGEIRSEFPPREGLKAPRSFPDRTAPILFTVTSEA